MTKSELAVQKHALGYNCCQSVACAFAEEVGVDESLLYKACEGFGAGMGTGQGVCGAISGAAIVAGLINSNGDIENPDQTKGGTTRLSGGMQKQFAERAHGLICMDIKTGNNGGPFMSCAECIALGAELVEEMLANR